MAKIAWDQPGQRTYETGVSKGVLYESDNSGRYTTGVPWNGLTTVTESPSGAEATPVYADNMKYLELRSAEEFGATIEAYTIPDEFYKYDGITEAAPGVYVTMQSRRSFGMSYQTRVGNDLEGTDYGYKIHLIYNATAAPSEKANTTINDSPEAITLSYEVTTTPVDAGDDRKPTSHLVIDSTKVSTDGLAALEDALYGTAGSDPRLPTPAEVIAFFSGEVTTVTPTEPTFDAATNTITIPTVAGVEYRIDGDVVTGAVPITEDTIVSANPTAGNQFPENVDSDWGYDYNVV